MGFTADRRLWLTVDSERVVDDGDPDAAFLLAGEGAEVSDEDAKRYDLKKKPKPADKQAPAPANKAR